MNTRIILTLAIVALQHIASQDSPGQPMQDTNLLDIHNIALYSGTISKDTPEDAYFLILTTVAHSPNEKFLLPQLGYLTGVRHLVFEIKAQVFKDNFTKCLDTDASSPSEPLDQEKLKECLEELKTKMTDNQMIRARSVSTSLDEPTAKHGPAPMTYMIFTTSVEDESQRVPLKQIDDKVEALLKSTSTPHVFNFRILSRQFSRKTIEEKSKTDQTTLVKVTKLNFAKRKDLVYVFDANNTIPYNLEFRASSNSSGETPLRLINIPYKLRIDSKFQVSGKIGEIDSSELEGSNLLDEIAQELVNNYQSTEFRGRVSHKNKNYVHSQFSYYPGAVFMSEFGFDYLTKTFPTSREKDAIELGQVLAEEKYVKKHLITDAQYSATFKLPAASDDTTEIPYTIFLVKQLAEQGELKNWANSENQEEPESETPGPAGAGDGHGNVSPEDGSEQPEPATTPKDNSGETNNKRKENEATTTAQNKPKPEKDSNQESSKTGSKIWIVLGVCLALMILVGVGVYAYWKSRKQDLSHANRFGRGKTTTQNNERIEV